VLFIPTLLSTAAEAIGIVFGMVKGMYKASIEHQDISLIPCSSLGD
jgi:hypothetical protein